MIFPLKAPFRSGISYGHIWWPEAISVIIFSVEPVLVHHRADPANLSSWRFKSWHLKKKPRQYESAWRWAGSKSMAHTHASGLWCSNSDLWREIEPWSNDDSFSYPKISHLRINRQGSDHRSAPLPPWHALAAAGLCLSSWISQDPEMSPSHSWPRITCSHEPRLTWT
jgi:hypothetical protein